MGSCCSTLNTISNAFPGTSLNTDHIFTKSPPFVADFRIRIYDYYSRVEVNDFINKNHAH